MFKTNIKKIRAPKLNRFSLFSHLSSFLFLISFFFSFNLSSLIFHLDVLQAQPYIYLGSDDYAFIDYLINSGRKIPQFVFLQPYDVSIFSSNAEAKGYYEKFWQKYYPENGVSGTLDLSEKGKYLNEVLVNRYQATGAVHLVYPHITLGNRTSINQEYKYDPKYAGDLSESEHWLYGRVNDAYMNVNFNGFNLFIGRMARNWGPVGHYSLFLSDEPYTYDHFLFSWEHDWIKLSVIFARLEDLRAYGLDDAQRPDSITYYPSARKFLAGHRLDLRILDNLQLALTEMTTYGGPERDFDLSFINPMTFYYGLQRNDKKLNNGKWAVDLFYKPIDRVTLYSQFMIDDVIVNNDPGVNDRARYPDRLAVYGSLRTGDLLLKGLNTDLGYTRIWNETYLSRWTWENYHYRELGLGYPCGSCEEIKLKLGYWGFFPLFLQNELIYGRYGSNGLTDVVRLGKETFPVRPVTYNLVNHFKINYHHQTYLNFSLDVLYVREPIHYLNRLNEGSDLTISMSVNLLLTTSFKNN